MTRKLPELKAELRRREAEKAKLDSEVAHLTRIIDGIEGLQGGPTPEPGPPLPGVADASNENLRGIAAVRRVMGEDERVWNAREVHAVLEQRGWLSPDAKFPVRGTEAAINRLWKHGELEKVGRGRYRYNKQEVPAETGTS